MANLATGIILTAGTLTFANEWLQTNKVNWKIPVATLILAATFDGIAHLDDKAATGLSVIVLVGAVTTEFNGKSVVEEIGNVVNSPATPAKRKAKK